MNARISPDTGKWEYSTDGQSRKGWLFFESTPKPTVTVSEIAENAGPVITDGVAVETWVVRAKNETELALDISASELVQVKAAYVALKAGTGTNTVRLERLEKVVARLLLELFGP